MAMIDVTQSYGARVLKHPQVRVWSHPVKGGDDFYRVFKNIFRAEIFRLQPSKTEMKEEPLIAFQGKKFSWKVFKKKFPSRLKEVV